MEITMETNDYEDLTAGELAEEYLYFRDLKSKLQKKFEAKEAVLDAELDKISSRLMVLCNEQDASSIKTDSGTIIRSLKTRYETKDWDSLYEFVLDHSAPYLLQKRINESAMKEFLETNPEDFPKGLNIASEYKISVRKPTKK